MNESWIPDGFHTITPNIIVDDAEGAISFFKEAFGATERYRLMMANGKIAHCEINLGNSVLNLGNPRMDGRRMVLSRKSMLKTPTPCSSGR